MYYTENRLYCQELSDISTGPFGSRLFHSFFAPGTVGSVCNRTGFYDNLGAPVNDPYTRYAQQNNTPNGFHQQLTHRQPTTDKHFQ